MRARSLLAPLVPLYRLALALRERRLASGREPIRRLAFPVISIGNLSTGGSGKTPLTIALAQALTSRGYQVDVLSRGYGRTSREPARVDPGGAADKYGDEPLLIARNAAVPVYVAPQRYDAGLLAEKSEGGGGFNPRTKPTNSGGALAPEGSFPLDPTASKAPPVARDRGSAVLKGHDFSRAESQPMIGGPLQAAEKPNRAVGRGFIPGMNHAESTRALASEVCSSGNPPEVQSFSAGSLAPGGMRAHLLDDGFQHRQLHRDVDILLLDRGDLNDRLLPAGNLREELRSANRAHVLAIPADDPALESDLRARGFAGPIWRLRRRMEIPAITGPVVAFCGIARPDQFFAGLASGGIHLAARIAFPDHHRWTARDLERLSAAARRAGATLVTTEKDQVRLGPLAASLPLLTVPLLIEIEDEPATLDDLERLINSATSSTSTPL